MLKLYLKQGWQLIRQNKFYTAVYILGTGLAITMVMIMAIVYHIRTANIAPESNRDRMLIVNQGMAKMKGENSGTHQWYLSYQTVKECFYSLKTPQVVSAAASSSELSYQLGDFYTSIPGGKDIFKSDVYTTDAAFFQVFNYSFISGKPYTEEAFQSGLHHVILAQSLALKLFNSLEVLNKTILINDVEFTVIGIVKDVSPTLSHAYAELWVPFTAIPAIEKIKGAEDIVGPLRSYILLKSKSDIPLTLEEIDRNRIKYNASHNEWEYVLEQDPVKTVFQSELRRLDYFAGYNELIIKLIIIAFIFMLVPAINLSGLTSSRMQERVSEMGIRKAFGANKKTLTNQILTENLLLTLLGGVAGLIFSFIIVYLMREILLGNRWEETSKITISIPMLINMRVFGYTFAVCLLLNVLSSYIPIWNATRKPIVQSLNDK